MTNIGTQVQTAALSWAKARDLDLEQLNPTQQKQVIADVGAALEGISPVEIRNTLLSVWVGKNEDGRTTTGTGDYNAALEQRSVQMSAMMAVRGELPDPRLTLGFEIALAGRRDGRVSIDDVDQILARFADGGMTSEQLRTLRAAGDTYNFTDAAKEHFYSSARALGEQAGILAPQTAPKPMAEDLKAAYAFHNAAELWSAGDEKGAAAAYTTVLGFKDPEVVFTAVVNIAVIALRAGDLQEVIKLDKKYAQVDGPPRLAAQVATLAVSAHRSLGNKTAAFDAAQRACDIHPTPATKMDLAIMLKNDGQLKPAIELLKGAIRDGRDVDPTIALAGYLVLDGREAEGQKLFDTMTPDRKNPAGYYTNAAWFSALKDDKPNVIANVKFALSQATDDGHRNVLRQYFKSEVDLAKYRADPDFQAALDG